MAATVARREPRRRLTWRPDAPRVGIHLAVAGGLMRAGRRARQIGATALQIFADNPTAWRRRPEPPPDAAQFVAYCRAEGIAPVAVHASYLINLAGGTEPLASQSVAGLAHELQRAPAYGASLVNVHIGSHRGEGPSAGIRRVATAVATVLGDAPSGVRLVLENSAGGGGMLGASLEELAAILDACGAAGAAVDRLAFCLDTAHLWGAGYDLADPDGAVRVLDRFAELIGLDRLALIHLNDSRSALGSRGDRHEHLGAGRIGPHGLGALMRDPRLPGVTTLVLETPGTDQGYDAVNLRRSWLLHRGATELSTLPAGAFGMRRRAAQRRGVEPADQREADDPAEAAEP